MSKLDFIKSYIDQCDVVIKSNNKEEAKKLQNVIIGVFENEIKQIKGMLTNYAPATFYTTESIDYISDIKLIQQKLSNHSYNIQMELEKREYELELARLKQPKVSAHAESKPTQSSILKANITVDLKQTIEKLDNLPKVVLSIKDRDELKQHILSLEDSGDKNKSWQIIKVILKFIADKGVDVAIATLPFIISKIS